MVGARLAQSEAFEHRPQRGEAIGGLLVEAPSPVAFAEVAEVEGELEVGGGAVDACAPARDSPLSEAPPLL